MSPAFVGSRSKRLEDGTQTLHNILVSANHHAVALLKPPDTSAGACIHEMQPQRGKHFCPAQGIFVVAVAAVNDDITCRQHHSQGGESFFRGIT